MPRPLRHAARLARRFLRPGLALLLVIAHAVAAFGFPVLGVRGQRISACGCGHTGGPSSGCCCSAGGCAVPEPEPVAPPEPVSKPACPKCRAHEPAPSLPKPVLKTAKPTVTWVAAWQARQCRGDGPLAWQAESPAVPPAQPAPALREPAAPRLVGLFDHTPEARPAVPLDPPPRSA